MARTFDVSSVILETGDCLSRDEFHRRYSLRPDIKKAELLQGVAYVASPLRSDVHGEPHGYVATWLGVYSSHVPGVRVSIEPTVYLSPDTEVQPDLVLYRYPPPEPRDARLRDGYLHGAPQLIVEIAASSASYDLNAKLRAYEQARVPEYLIWRVIDGAIDFRRLDGDKYVLVEPNEHGVIESAQFPGLRLHVPMMLAGDMAGVLAALAAPAAG